MPEILQNEEKKDEGIGSGLGQKDATPLYFPRLVGGTLELGKDDTCIKYTPTDGFWIGNRTFASAPYSVDNAGNVIATNLSIFSTFTANIATTIGKAACVLASNGQVIKCTSLLATTSKFIGFFAETKSAGGSVKVRIVGKQGSQTGLTIASDYYLQDTVDAAYTAITQNTQNAFYDSTPTQKKPIQTFIPTATLIYQIIVYINNSGGNYDAQARLYTLDKDTLVATSATTTISGGGPSEITFNFATPVLVSIGSIYSFEICAVGGGDLGASIDWYYKDTSVYSSGYYRLSTDAQGVDPARGDLYFIVNQKNGAGAIGTVAGSISKKVGIATSATDILILNS